MNIKKQKSKESHHEVNPPKKQEVNKERKSNRHTETTIITHQPINNKQSAVTQHLTPQQQRVTLRKPTESKPLIATPTKNKPQLRESRTKQQKNEYVNCEEKNVNTVG